MWKTFLALLFVPLVLCAVEQPTLVLDRLNEKGLPPLFHTCQDPYRYATNVTRKGLDNLRMSGSAQFSELEFTAAYDAIRKIHPSGPIIDVDLRSESHGFVDGNAIHWFVQENAINQGKTDSEIKQDEQQRLAALRSLKEVTITNVFSHTTTDMIGDSSSIAVPVKTVSDEEQLVKKQGAEYFRLYVLDHHAPTDTQVDAFITFVKQLPPDGWLHFHCLGGMGRTMTFMCLFDMMRNAKQVSFDEIIQRQEALQGSYKVLHLDSPDSWKYPYTKHRAEFLKDFYNYAKTNQDDFKTSWQDYKLRLAGHHQF